MVYLRNRLASYELSVARYYMKRQAYIAAAQRAKQTIEQYDGAPAVREALEIMIVAYDKLGLGELAQQARTVYQDNYSAAPGSGAAGADEGPRRKRWWKPWS